MDLYIYRRLVAEPVDCRQTPFMFGTRQSERAYHATTISGGSARQVSSVANRIGCCSARSVEMGNQKHDQRRLRVGGKRIQTLNEVKRGARGMEGQSPLREADDVLQNSI